MRECFGERFAVPDGYLNTASIGVPPARVVDAVSGAVADWAGGAARAPDYDPAVATAREAFARLVGVGTERVAIGSAVSELVGLVAAALPDGAAVAVPAGEFTSLSFPFAAHAARGVRVTEVGLAELPGRAAGFDLVACSVVQSADGALADLDGLRAAQRLGTRVLLDVTQSLGCLDAPVGWADAVVGASYKWLLAPRGAAWMALAPDLPAVPLSASWYAGRDRWDSVYGLPLRLADDARALDVSPAWFSHVGAAAALPWLAGLDRAAVRAHCVGLADALREALGMAPAGSAIVAVDHPGAQRALAEAGVAAAVRAGRVRLAFGLYNTVADLDLAVAALRGLPAR